ncbi:co-chaperone GroES [Candidatus Saccharibacteria bacterium]|nr:co-chaperone GroES [Candidatus Saccharibacteria bacterium]MCB9821154.1 co-chaperone GroES [Candidatus Nomurabacteria bacterium]
MSKLSIVPLADLVLAKNDEAQAKTASGLFLPENAQEKPKTATVEAVGPEVKGIKAGDQIIFKSYSTTDIKHGGVDYILVKEEDVLAKVG